MKTYPALCKFCGRALSLQIAEDYNALSDPLKLMPYAACNQCSDLRVTRRNLESRFQGMAVRLQMTPKEEREKFRMPVTKSLEEYLAMIKNCQGHALNLEPLMIDIFLKQPEDWWDMVQRLWRAKDRS